MSECKKFALDALIPNECENGITLIAPGCELTYTHTHTHTHTHNQSNKQDNRRQSVDPFQELASTFSEDPSQPQKVNNNLIMVVMALIAVWALVYYRFSRYVAFLSYYSLNFYPSIHLFFEQYFYYFLLLSCSHILCASQRPHPPPLQRKAHPSSTNSARSRSACRASRISRRPDASAPTLQSRWVVLHCACVCVCVCVCVSWIWF